MKEVFPTIEIRSKNYLTFLRTSLYCCEVCDLWWFLISSFLLFDFLRSTFPWHVTEVQIYKQMFQFARMDSEMFIPVYERSMCQSFQFQDPGPYPIFRILNSLIQCSGSGDSIWRLGHHLRLTLLPLFHIFLFLILLSWTFLFSTFTGSCGLLFALTISRGKSYT